jgi:putative DNA primase/helicase
MIDHLRAIGIDPGGELVDGKVTRATCSCKPSKKGRDGNGWYLFHADEPATLTWGCWNTGCPNVEGGRLTAKNERTLTPTEREIIKARIEAERKAREEERQRVEQATREKAARLWECGRDVSADHPYIVKKGIRPAGIRQVKEMLLIPMSDTGTGGPSSLQLIFPDSGKKFLTGTGAIPGPLYHVIRGNGGMLYIVEGWATGCSVHEATGGSVVVAFSSGKLPAVASVLRDRFPDREIVIAGDRGNGSEKAVEAARKIGGKVVFPVMPDGIEGTDFNDLCNAADLKEVARQLATPAEPISTPAPATENASKAESGSLDNPLDAAIQRLSKLTPLQYDQVRKEEAKALNVRPATLDGAVRNARNGGPEDVPFEEVEPWPEPVDGAELLTGIAATVRRFIVCEPQTAHAVALWCSMTWFIDDVQVAPLAVITAPEKRCGKSMLLFLIGRMVTRPLMSSSITPSALFRSIDAWQPTLLIDEVDACLKDNEELRGLINCGHTRESAFTIRCVGDDHTPKKFNVWGAKALSGIGHVADTLMDRAILLELRRKLPHESVDRIRHAEPGLFDELRAKLARFAEDNAERVRLARPVLPPSLNDRAQDNWEPLLAIAMVAGGGWYDLAVTAALKLSGSESPTQSIGVELLADIQETFERLKVDRISTADLIKELCADDEKSWATYNRGLQIKPRQVAAKLKGFGIFSKTIRVNSSTPKGYERDSFTEAFSRYVHPPSLSATTPQPAQTLGLSVAASKPVSETHHENETPVALVQKRFGSVAEMKSDNTLKSLTCGVVADSPPQTASEDVFDLTGIEDFEVTA